jgi:hypothetical protein
VHPIVAYRHGSWGESRIHGDCPRVLGFRSAGPTYLAASLYRPHWYTALDVRHRLRSRVGHAAMRRTAGPMRQAGAAGTFVCYPILGVSM